MKNKMPNRMPKGKFQKNKLSNTLKYMRKFMVEGARHPYIIELAGRITNENGVRPAFFNSLVDYDMARMRAIYDYVRENFTYVHDGFDVANGIQEEVVRDVEVIARGKAGDCDDLTILVGALVLATFDGWVDKNGVRQPPIEVWLYGKNNIPLHVFPIGVIYNGQRVALDAAALPGNGFGDLPSSGSPDGEMFWKVDFF